MTGASGIGKSCLVASVLTNEAYRNFFKSTCGINAVVWIDTFGSNDVAGVRKKMLEMASSMVNAKKRSSKGFPPFYNITQMLRYFRLKQKQRILFVLDHVHDWQLIDELEGKKEETAIVDNNGQNNQGDGNEEEEKEEDLLSICAIFLPEANAEARKECLQIEKLSNDQTSQVLASQYSLKNTIKDEKIKRLAKICRGNHLLIGEIADRLNGANSLDEADRELQQVRSDLEMAAPSDDGQLISQFYANFLAKIDTILLKNFSAFLLFKPGEPVSVNDLMVLWGFTGDVDALERTLQYCSFFEKRGLIRKIRVANNHSNTNTNSSSSDRFYFINRFLYKTAWQFMLDHLELADDDDSKKKILLKIATGHCCSDGTNVKANCDIFIHCCNTSSNANLLQRFVSELDVADLVWICKQGSKLSKNVPFLLHLYQQQQEEGGETLSSTKNDQNLNKPWQRQMVYRILKKINDHHDIGPIIKAIEPESRQSLMKAIFDDFNLGNGRVDKKLMRLVLKFKVENTQQNLIDQILLQRDRLAVIIARNDLNQLQQHFQSTISSSFEQQPSFEPMVKLIVRMGRIEMLKLVGEVFSKDRLADIGQEGKEETLFSIACANGHLEIVNYLYTLSSECLRWRNDSDQTLLMIAAEAGHTSVVRFLAELDPEMVEIETSSNQGKISALGFAAMNGHLETVKYLVEKCQDAFSYSSKGNSMIYAAEGGHLKTVQYLLDQFPEMNIAPVLTAALLNGQQETALHLIGRNKQLIGQQLGPMKWSPLSVAVVECDLDLVMDIYKMAPESIKLRDNAGWSPLMSAVNASAPLEIVAFLYDMDDDQVRSIDGNGKTALMLAAQNCDLDMVEFLYDKFPEAVEICDQAGDTPLMKAAFTSDDETSVKSLQVVEFLYDKYPKAATITNMYEQSALVLAAWKANLDVVEFLLGKFGKAIGDNYGKSGGGGGGDEPYGVALSTVLRYAKSALVEPGDEEHRMKRDIIVDVLTRLMRPKTTRSNSNNRTESAISFDVEI